MTQQKLNDVINERLEKCFALLGVKAKEYATDDRLHNFKIAAQLQNCTPITALAGMMAKHTVSVYDLIRDNENGADIPLEMWDEKIGDSINYLLLLTGLIIEQHESGCAEQNVN